MSIGFDVCVKKSGSWVVYAFFDDAEQDDAIFTAQDIKQNYRAVCVLWAEQMNVVYYYSKDNDKKPSYLDIRSDIKLAKEERKKNVAQNRKVKKAQKKPVRAQAPTAMPIPEKDELFTKKDQKQALSNTIIFALIGIALTVLAPFVFQDMESTIKLVVVLIMLAITGSGSAATYYVSEQSMREKNRKKSLGSDEVWDNIKDSTFNKNVKNYSSTMKKEERDEEQENAFEREQQLQDTQVSPEDGWIEMPNVDLTAGINIQATEEILEQENDIFSTDLEKVDTSGQDIDPTAESTIEEMLTAMVSEAHKEAWSDEEQCLTNERDFAFTLYIAGATVKALEQLKQPAKTLYRKVPLVLTRLNINPSVSEERLIQLKDLLQYPQYMATYRHGENDAARYVSAGEKPREVKAAFALWEETEANENPIEDELTSAFSAVMFTDIVSFTEKTRVNGEAWVRDVIRAHNDIIRKVLEECDGKEIKHTGDGILATFESVSNATDAALTFQRSIEKFNEAMPNREFHVRIGISAGEIIEMDNDIFGESVNLAARLMQHCDGGQTVMNETVKTIIEDRSNYTVKQVPNVELKGFGNQSIYHLEERG